MSIFKNLLGFSPQIVFDSGGGGGGSSSGGGGGSRADKKGAQAVLTGPKTPYVAPNNNNDAKKRAKAAAEAQAAAAAKAAAAQAAAAAKAQREAAAKIARDRAASDQRAREEAQAKAAQAAQQAEIKRMQEAQARQQAEKARQAEQARQAAEAQARQQAQAAQEAEVQRMLAAQARQQAEAQAAQEQARQQAEQAAQAAQAAEIQRMQEAKAAQDAQNERNRLASLAPSSTGSMNPQEYLSTPSVTDGLSNVEFVSKDTTPSYMPYFEPIEEPVIGGRGNGAAEVAIRQGPIGNYPATDYSKVYEEQGIPRPYVDITGAESVIDASITQDLVDSTNNALSNDSSTFTGAGSLESLPSTGTGEPILNLPVSDGGVDPVSMESDVGALGQVSRYGVYAGDGFEFKDSGQGYQTRTFTGEDNNLGQDVLIANELAYGSPEDREAFKQIGQLSFDEGSDFAFSQGSANDGNLLDFLKTGSFNASDSFADQYGLTNEQPVVEADQIGALPSVTSEIAPEFATTTADYTGLEDVYNTQAEEMANFFTPNDGASYVRGQLVDDATGQPIRAGGMTSTGNKIRGTFDNQKNNIEGFGGLGAGAIRNSSRETMANLLTPGDNAAYVDGQLINTLTGESLEGGGYTYDAEGKNRDYVYGVSDDYSNNLQVDTTGMGDIEARAAIANQVMKRDIPPSDLAYFASFLPGMYIPLIGGYLGEKMLEGGIEGRRSVMAEQTAALQAGATPLYNDKGEYVGYNNAPSSSSYGDFDAGGSTATVNYDPSSYKDRDSADQESTSIFDKAREDRMNRSDDNATNATNNPVVNSIYNRYYKGGSGYGLPEWLRRYASGVSINQLLTKETLDDGTVMYKTPDGKFIDAKYLPNAIVGADEELV